MNKVEFLALIILVFYGLMIIPMTLWVLWDNYCKKTQKIAGVTKSNLEYYKNKILKIGYVKKITSIEFVSGTTVGGEAYYNINYVQRGERKDAMITWAAVLAIVIAVYSCLWALSMI